MALNQIARIFFLKREYVRALGALKEVSGVDPEDDPVVLPPLVTVVGRRSAREDRETSQ